MTEGKAILIGTLWVNIPVFSLMFSPILILLAFVPEPSVAVAISVFVPGFIFAWLWWSINVPKWRLWAYKRVSDIKALKNKAILAGLVWPDGSLLSRTEIKSKLHAEQERAFEQNA
jgi:hypothetical protein